MNPVLVSIQVGLPVQLGDDAATDPFERAWTTGIFKSPVSGAVSVRRLGLEGDGQADLTVHGGSDKAVCVYPVVHYAAWHARPELAAMGPGAFGENFSIAGLTEADVCIGDRFRVGSVVVQVSQPRQPCWKLARKWGIREFAQDVVASGRTGWYFRVLEEGTVTAGMPLILQERPHQEWPLTRANRVMHGRPRDRDAAVALAQIGPLSESWRATLSKR